MSTVRQIPGIFLWVFVLFFVIRFGFFPGDARLLPCDAALILINV